MSMSFLHSEYMLAATIMTACATASPAAENQIPASINRNGLVRYYDFSNQVPGRAENLVSEKNTDLIVPAKPNYRQRIGSYAKSYDKNTAPGRDGQPGAVRVGKDNLTLEGMRYYPGKNGKFTVSCWVYVYDVKKNFNGTICNLGHGYKQGFRVIFNKAKWCPNGKLSLVYGIPSGSGNFGGDFQLGKWHNLVISSDGSTLFLYVDGKLAGSKKVTLRLPQPNPKREWWKDRGGLKIGGKWYSKANLLDFKIDELAVYNRPLSANEIKKMYEAEKPLMPGKQSEALEKYLAKVKVSVSGCEGGFAPVNRKITLKAEIPASDNSNTPTTLKVRIKDITGKIIYSENIGIKALPAVPQSEFKLPACGLYRVKAELYAKEKLMLRRNMLLGATVPLSTAAIKASPLGANNVSITQPEAKAVGVPYSRIVCDWARFERKKGMYNWFELDRIVEKNRAQKMDMVICFTGMPRWLKRQAKNKNLPEDMERYQQVLGLLVNRYDDVKYWEIWNAPQRRHGYGVFTGSEAQRAAAYATLLKTAREVIKDDLPEAKVIGGGPELASNRWLAALMKTDALKQLDIISTYWQGPCPVKSYSGKNKIAAINRTLKAKGFKVLPVWNFDGGCYQPTRNKLFPEKDKIALGHFKDGNKDYVIMWPYAMPGEYLGACWQIQEIALLLSAGAERCFMLAGPSLYYPEFNNSDGDPGWRGLALAALVSVISPETKLAESQTKNGCIVINFTRKDGKKGAIVFAEKPQSLTLQSKSAGQVTGMDMIGNPLNWKNSSGTVKVNVGPAPIYIMTEISTIK